MKLFSIKTCLAVAFVTLCLASCQDYQEDLYADLNERISNSSTTGESNYEALAQQISDLSNNIGKEIEAQNEKINELLNSKDTIYVSSMILERIQENLEKLAELQAYVNELGQALAALMIEEGEKIAEKAAEIGKKINDAAIQAAEAVDKARQDIEDFIIETGIAIDDAVREMIERRQEIHEQRKQYIIDRANEAKEDIDQLISDIEDLIYYADQAQKAINKSINKLINPYIKSISISTIPGAIVEDNILSVYWNDLNKTVTFPAAGQKRGFASFTADELNGVSAETFTGRIISDNGDAGALIINVNPYDADLSDQKFQIVNAKNQIIADELQPEEDELFGWWADVTIDDSNFDKVKADFWGPFKPLVWKIIDNKFVNIEEIHAASLNAMTELGQLCAVRTSYVDTMRYGYGENDYKTYTRYIQSPYSFVTVAQKPINMNAFTGISKLTKEMLPDVATFSGDGARLVRDICDAIAGSDIHFHVGDIDFDLPVYKVSVDSIVRAMVHSAYDAIEVTFGVPATELLEEIVADATITVEVAKLWSLNVSRALDELTKETVEHVESLVTAHTEFILNNWDEIVLNTLTEIRNIKEAIEAAEFELTKVIIDDIKALNAEIEAYIIDQKNKAEAIINAQIDVLDAIYTAAKQQIPVEVKRAIKQLFYAYVDLFDDYAAIVAEVTLGHAKKVTESIVAAAEIAFGLGYATAVVVTEFSKDVVEALTEFNVELIKYVIEETEPVRIKMAADFEYILGEISNDIMERRAHLEQMYIDRKNWIEHRIEIIGNENPEEIAKNIVADAKQVVKDILKASDIILNDQIEFATAVLEDAVNMQIDALVRSANVMLIPANAAIEMTKAIARANYNMITSEFAHKLFDYTNGVIEKWNAIKNDPALLFDPMLYYVSENYDIEMVSMNPDYPTVFNGTGSIPMIISTLMNDEIVPAYKKFITITSGQENPEGFGEVLNGSENIVLFDAAASGDYTIKYSLVDYAGNISTNAFYVRVVE